VPTAYHRRLVYTDGYGAYAEFFSSWHDTKGVSAQHRLCAKFDSGTCTVEGVNHSLRHRCGALVRRGSARCRSLELLSKRLDITVEAHNRGPVSDGSSAAPMQRRRNDNRAADICSSVNDSPVILVN